MAPRRGNTITKDDTFQIVGIPPNGDTILVPTSLLPGHVASTNMSVLGSADNPVNLSDAPTDALNAGAHPKDVGIEDNSKILGHFSDALDEIVKVCPWCGVGLLSSNFY